MDAHEKIWVIVLDSNSCKILNYLKKDKKFESIKQLNHPENKLPDRELTSDKPGHYKSSHSTHGAYAQPSDPKEIKIDKFAREVANNLEEGRNHQSYQKLIIIAAPHMNGLLQKHINKHVKKLIYHNIEKDLMHQTDQELLSTIINLR